MQEVNSINQFQRLKEDLAKEDREMKSIERDIQRKEADHKRAKDAFEKVDREMKELIQKKIDLTQRHTKLESELRNLQRSIDEAKRHGSSSLRL